MPEQSDGPPFDTQLLPWWAVRPERLQADSQAMLGEGAQRPTFSVGRLWAVAIQASPARAEAQVRHSKTPF